jgi:hypothetical protein
MHFHSTSKNNIYIIDITKLRGYHSWIGIKKGVGKLFSIYIAKLYFYFIVNVFI